MINYKKALKSNSLLKALTGLKIKQFNLLISLFRKNLEITSHKIRGVNIFLGRDFTLKSTEEKLFYILFYLKCYPTFEVAAFFFDVNRSSCCRWTHWFMDALEMTLGKKCVLPKRKIRSFTDLITMFPELNEIFIDCTERPIRRPKDSSKQKIYYSGKKKRHTIKNLIVSNKKKEILILPITREGKVHDYQFFKSEKLGDKIPTYLKVFIDNGFQGIETDYPLLNIKMPKRKPKNRELTDNDKQVNKKISKKRIIIEHAIGGVKRYNAISDIYRNIKQGFEDKIMTVSCGLWNYYLKTT